MPELTVLYCWTYSPRVFSVSWEMPISCPMRIIDVQSTTGITPKSACAVTGTISADAIRATMAIFLLRCGISFLSVLSCGRRQALRVGHSQSVDRFECRQFRMLLPELLSEFHLDGIARGRPVIERRRGQLDNRARLCLVGDQKIAFREMSGDTAQFLY